MAYAVNHMGYLVDNSFICFGKIYSPVIYMAEITKPEIGQVNQYLKMIGGIKMTHINKGDNVYLHWQTDEQGNFTQGGTHQVIAMFNMYTDFDRVPVEGLDNSILFVLKSEGEEPIQALHTDFSIA